MSRGLTVEQAWEKFQQFKRDNANKLLKNGDGETVTARNFDEFQAKWKAMKGGNRLKRIEYTAMYRTKATTAKKIRQRLVEEAYTARGISKEEWMHMSIRERGRLTKRWNIASLEEIKLNKLALGSNSYLDKQGIKAMVDDYYRKRYEEEEILMKEKLGLDPNMQLGDSYKREIRKNLGAEISDYFFGS